MTEEEKTNKKPMSDEDCQIEALTCELDLVQNELIEANATIASQSVDLIKMKERSLWKRIWNS